MKFEIKSYFSGRVLFEGEFGSMRLCMEAAVKAKADLRGAALSDAALSDADLRGADLSDAELRGADLSGADLRGAALSDADLRGADLRGADLRDADLRGAALRGADLRGAALSDAALRGADLRGADLRDADLRGAALRGADLSGADLRGADLQNNSLPFAEPEQQIKNLDTVRELILDKEDRLQMDHWHDGEGWRERTCAEEALCGTTHCLAGWLQVCSTDAKVRDLMPELAGIVQARVAAKMFYRSNDEALAWLRDRKYVQDLAPQMDAA